MGFGMSTRSVIPYPANSPPQPQENFRAIVCLSGRAALPRRPMSQKRAPRCFCRRDDGIPALVIIGGNLTKRKHRRCAIFVVTHKIKFQAPWERHTPRRNQRIPHLTKTDLPSGTHRRLQTLTFVAHPHTMLRDTVFQAMPRRAPERLFASFLRYLRHFRAVNTPTPKSV